MRTNPARHRSPRAAAEHGFTLLELLVTIAVVAVLATTGVLAVRRITPRAQTAACTQDAKVLAAAEDAYHTLHGTYATMDGLVADGVLESPSSLHDVTVAGGSYTVAGKTGGACAVPETLTLASAGWSTNGPAVLGESLTLTPSPRGAQTAGSAWVGPIRGDSFTVEFDTRISGGYGIALAFIDPSAGTSALGATLAGRGFGGLPGTAVVLGTSRRAGDPGSNFMGVATGWSRNRLTYAGTTTAGMSRLTTGSHHVVATVAGGRLTVTYDGNRALSTTVTLPRDVLVGFTGSASSTRNSQTVSNVAITR